MSTADEPSDSTRFPGLTAHGRHMLDHLREHPNAPIYRNQSGHRLLPEDLERVRIHAAQVRATMTERPTGAPPRWVSTFVRETWARVPYWRKRGAPPARFEDVPTTSRADLARDIAAHVPDDAPVDRLINFRTTGTTGHPLLVASHPVVAASYLAYHERALRRFDLELRAGPGDVAVVLLGDQTRCFTYVSVVPMRGEAGLAKINLDPADWRDPDDRARYLEALAPEVLTGDPLSFGTLLSLPVRLEPRALFSTSMTLLPGLRAALETRFGCPVLDLYSLNEAGPVAVFDPRVGGHVVLQSELYVEIVDADGHPVPAGVRGEVTLTGGFNFCLPLVRYRTGDHAALDLSGPEPVLVGLEGRAPVRFRATDGTWRNNVDVTHVLGRFPLSQFSLHQSADGALTLRTRGAETQVGEMVEALRVLLGPALRVTCEPLALDADGRKPRQYTSDLPEALATSCPS